MHTTQNRYGNQRCRDELALRMIHHEARTCTIRACTGLSDDRIRRLYKAYASEHVEQPARRRRGKSPRQVTFFVRNAHAQFESSLLASAFTAFGLIQMPQVSNTHRRAILEPGSLEYGRLFCDAYETHQQLLTHPTMSFEHAWFLLQLLVGTGELQAVRCRYCDSYYLRDAFNVCQQACPACKLKHRGLRSLSAPRPAPCAARTRQRRPCANNSARESSAMR